MRPKFWSVLLYDQQFPRYHPFYNSPLTNMLNIKKKRTNKIAKNSKFHYSFNNFGNDPPQEYTWILGTKSGALFQRICHLKLFPPYGLMLTKRKKNWQKSKIWTFTILWTTVVETLPRSMFFWEWIWCVLSEEMSFETFAPIMVPC